MSSKSPLFILSALVTLATMFATGLSIAHAKSPLTGEKRVVNHGSGEPTDTTAESSGRDLHSPLSLPTSFSYQGRLQRHGSPTDGSFDFSFELYDQREGGTFLGRVDRFDVPVVDGAFRAPLDFGQSVAAGDTPWLQVSVRPTGGSAYVSLGARQRVVGAGTTCAVNEDVRINGTLTVDRPGGVDPDVILSNGRLSLHRGPSSFSGLHLTPGGVQSTGNLGLILPLFLNADGGNVGIGTTAVPSAPLSIAGLPDVETAEGGALVIGEPSGVNLAIDGNEIQARNNGATANLLLNFSGGDVRVGGNLDIGMVFQTRAQQETTIDAFCPVAGTRIISGGCSSANVNDPIEASFPLNSTTWRCIFQDTAAGNNQTTAICGRLQ